MDIETAYQLIVDKLTDWMHTLIVMLPNLLLAVLIVLATAVIARIAFHLVRRVLSKVSDNVSISGLIANMVHLSVLAIGVFIALGVLKLDKTVTSLLAGAGIVGLALGFAFQDIAANFIAGIMMSIRKPVSVGDVIESNGHFGTVTGINLRTTAVRRPNGPLVLLPNKDVFQQPLENFSQLGRRRVDLSVGVSYGDDLELVERVTVDAIQALPQVLRDEDVSFVYTGFGDSSINFDVRYWIDFTEQAQYLSALSEGVKAVKRTFDTHDITIPFPIRTLDFGIKGGQPLTEVLEARPQAALDAPTNRSENPPKA